MFPNRYIKYSFLLSLVIFSLVVVSQILCTSSICYSLDGVKLLTKRREARHGGDNKHILGLIFQHESHTKTGPKLSSVTNNVTGHSCTFTYDQSMLMKSDVVFFPAKLMGHQMPPSRASGQRWVYFSHESLLYYPLEPRFRFVFNHTMTYHSHSDIPVPMGRTIKKEEPHFNVTGLKKKSKSAVWMSSHCDTLSQREELVRQLATYVKVDIYGGCGARECSRKRPWCEDIMSDYKFYLAFENSKCDGYISEKPWVGLDLGMVPVVYGAGSEAYRRALPQHSYIDVNRFDTVSQLAKYIQLLEKEDELYQKYFDWKIHYDFTYNRDASSMVCDYLHETRNSGEHRVDLEAFYTDNRSTCHDPPEYFT